MNGIRGMWLAAVVLVATGASAVEEGFTELFDGKTLNGWKPNEKPESWNVVDGAIVANGKPRSHLFYVGDEKPFKNFELRIEILTKPNSNGGVIFQTKWQDSGWLKNGFEAQVNNTYAKDPVKSGSLYHVMDVKEAPAKDDEWYTMSVTVDGKHIVIKVNDKVTADYTEPEGKAPGKDFPQLVGEGAFALQAHDDHSTVMYRNIRVKRLP